MNKDLEKYRSSYHIWQSEKGDNFGLFYIPTKIGKPPLKIICSLLGEMEWDHVSVSLPNRCPTWGEMTKVKNLFFGKNVTAIQFHPKESCYINNHPFCLHLWRNLRNETELPPTNLIGVK